MKKKKEKHANFIPPPHNSLILVSIYFLGRMPSHALRADSLSASNLLLLLFTKFCYGSNTRMYTEEQNIKSLDQYRVTKMSSISLIELLLILHQDSSDSLCSMVTR